MCTSGESWIELPVIVKSVALPVSLTFLRWILDDKQEREGGNIAVSDQRWSTIYATCQFQSDELVLTRWPLLRILNVIPVHLTSLSNCSLSSALNSIRPCCSIIEFQTRSITLFIHQFDSNSHVWKGRKRRGRYEYVRLPPRVEEDTCRWRPLRGRRPDLPQIFPS